MIQRDADGNTTASKGVDLKPHKLSVYNARAMRANQPGCELNGFELLSAPLTDDALDLRNHKAFVTHYYPQCEKLVGELTGGNAYAFDHNVRSATGKMIMNA
jgi:hypothetical protein